MTCVVGVIVCQCAMAEIVGAACGEASGVSPAIGKDTIGGNYFIITTKQTDACHGFDDGVVQDQAVSHRGVHGFGLDTDEAVFDDGIVKNIVESTFVNPNSIPLTGQVAIVCSQTASLKGDDFINGSVDFEGAAFVNPHT